MPEPPLPGERWIRVRNRQTGICASDLSLLLVRGGARISIGALPGYSSVYLGHEVVSDVVETAPGVEGVRVGDRVVLDTTILGPTCLSQEISPICRHCSDGNYALCENQSLQEGPARVGGGWGDGYIAHESEVYRVPQSLSDDRAVLMEPASVALRTVMREAPRPGDHVLVVGCGVLGLLACACAKIVQPDLRITAMARYPHQASAAVEMGADVVLSDQAGYEEHAEQTGARLYEGRFGNCNLIGGYDVVYDMIGSAATMGDSLRWARAGGTVVVAGISFDLVKLDLTPVWHQEVTLKGITGHDIDASRGQPAQSLGLVAQWMSDGTLEVGRLITHHYPFEQFREAVAMALNKRSGAIKVVVQM